MSRSFTRRSFFIALIGIGLPLVGCGRTDALLQQHREKFQSLASSARAVAEAWLGGDTSGTYTLTALDQIFLLAEKERAALARDSAALVDPRAAELADSADRLERLLAKLTVDVRGGDAASMRASLAEIPFAPPTP